MAKKLNYMELTNNQKKIDLVAKLVKEGAIDFNEAIELLQESNEKQYIYYPISSPATIIQPQFPYYGTTTAELNGATATVNWDFNAVDRFNGTQISTV